MASRASHAQPNIAEYARRRVAETRAAQGLSERTDDDVLEVAAAIVSQPGVVIHDVAA